MYTYARWMFHVIIYTITVPNLYPHPLLLSLKVAFLLQVPRHMIIITVIIKKKKKCVKHISSSPGKGDY